MDPKVSCRLCLNKTLNPIKIFSDEGIRLRICDILNKHFPSFEIAENDDKSGGCICTICWENVEKFHVFHTEICRRHISDPFKQEVDVKSEISDDDDVNNWEVNLNIADESEEDVDDMPLLFRIKKKELSSPTSLEVKSTPSTRLDRIDETTSVEDSDSGDSDYHPSDEDTKKTVIRILTKPPAKQESKGEIGEGDTSKMKKRRVKTQEELEQIKEDNKLIQEYFELRCEICDKNFTVFEVLKEHKRSKHNADCFLIHCDKKLQYRMQILDHIHFHITPDKFRCLQCNKIFSNQPALSHHTKSHIPEDQWAFQCSQCGRKFATKKRLSNHSERHKAAIFQCEQCPRKYPTQKSLNTHRKSHERNQQFICQECGEIYDNKSNFIKHQRMKHVKEKMQCPKCDKFLKNRFSYSRHLKRHEEEHLTIICDICGKQSKTKDALIYHKIRVHEKRKNHTCEYCGKEFFKKLCLVEHVATHTEQYLYSCAYCSQKFRAASALYVHRKNLHPIEYQEWLKTTGTNVPINY